MMNFRKDWETIEGFTYEEVTNRVTNVFAKWEKSNLIITSGRRERNTSDTFGLPYTSSGVFASLGCHCNVNAVLKSDRNYVIYELAITERNEIVAYLTDADENEKYIVTQIYINNDYNIELVRQLVRQLLQHSSAAVTQRYIGIQQKQIETALQNHIKLL